MEKYIYISLFAPLIGSFICALFSSSKKLVFLSFLSTVLIAISTFATFKLFYYVYITDEVLSLKLFDWIDIGALNISFSFVVDNISVVMMGVVTIVSTMVHIYSIDYMKDDKSFNRYFAYLSLFVFSMLVLVMTDNFAVLFIGWEGVGVCSWLLIGFWYEKNSAIKAANEAFIMNRIGDIGILLAMFLIYWNLGTLNYQEVFAQVSTLDNEVLSYIGVLLFIGAMGKSAQFPLHTWLANAMEGPTPVSALIHAATMVTAGVYLLIRANELYALIPQVGYFIAVLGTFVAIFAASMAIVNNDLKRIIAYSTLSQLGYMFASVGLGAYWVALFHLVTHAFFKSVLFLCAGNIMHAMNNELDIRKMGSLHKKMKKTSYIMIISSLSLCGIFPLAGFFSKDKILEVAFSQNAIFLWIILIVTAFLTAFYSFRLIMKVFFVKANYNEEEINPHESSNFVLASMYPLVLLAIIAGFFEHFFEDFTTKILPTWQSNLSFSTTWILILLTTAISILGILYAIFIHKKLKEENEKKGFLYKLLSNEYYIPKIYETFIVKPYYKLSSWVFEVIEVKIIDNSIDNFAHFISKVGLVTRVIQSGNLSSFLRLMAFGLFFGLVLALSLSVL